MRILSPVTQLISGFDTPEGPAFDRHGNLFFVNWSTASIVRRTPDGEASEWFNTGGIPAGLAFHADGSLYVADEGEHIHGILRITPDGERTTIVDAFEGEPLNGANDLVFDEAGVLYFSDPWRSSLERPIGGFYRFFSGGRLERIDHGLAFPNGVAIAPDGSVVYLAETRRNRILRYRLEPNGTVGDREVFATLGDDPGPDGMAFDVEGHLYVARFGAGRVDVLDGGGRVMATIPVPGRNVTNVAFGGGARTTLVITEVETGGLYQVELDTPGRRLFADVAD